MLSYVTDPGSPGGLALRSVPDQQPAANEAVVGVAAYALNRGELALLEQRPEGWAPGQDIAGVVLTAALDGSGPPIGARVFGVAHGGGWAEQVAVATHRLAVLPDTVDLADAAAVPISALTALRALREGGPLLGRVVLVTGASGGVGSFAVQLARLAGAQVIAQVSGLHRVDAARALGAAQVLTGPIPPDTDIDVVLDGVGGPALVDALHHLVPGGTAIAYGRAGGEASTISFTDFAHGQLGRLIGFFVYATGEQTFGQDLQFLGQLLAAGELTASRGPARDWSETRSALADLRERRVVGKVVLTVTSQI